MEETQKLTRRTIFIFLKNYNSFTSKPLLLLLPFSASILTSQSFLHVPSLFLLYPFFAFSLFPLVMAKSSILQTLILPKLLFPPPSLSTPLKIQTFYMGTIISISAAYSSSKSLPFVAEAVYYTIRTNAAVIFNLAFTVSIVEGSNTIDAIRGAVSLRVRESRRVCVFALAPSLGFVAIEALFRYRVVGMGLSGKTLLSIAVEVLLISCLYSVIIVLETIACFVFIRECESSTVSDEEQGICRQFEDLKVGGDDAIEDVEEDLH